MQTSIKTKLHKKSVWGAGGIKKKKGWDLHKIMCLFRESGNKQLINFVDTMAKSLHRFKPFGVF